MHTITRWCACLGLALLPVGLATSAHAATIYNFTFNDGTTDVAAGSFTTSGPAADPGYELLASMTFDFAIGVSARVYGPFTTTRFSAGAAYNPVTGAFINHFLGNTYSNLGLFNVRRSDGADIRIHSVSFGLAGILDGTYSNVFFAENLAAGRLTVTPTAPAVPEPTSLVLLGSGLIGAATAARRRRATSPRRRA